MPRPVRLVVGPYGHPLNRLTLFIAVIGAVLVVEHLTRAVVLAVMPLGGDWISLAGPLGLLRSDHHAAGVLAPMALRYLFVAPVMVLAVLMAGHAPLLRRWLVIAGGLMVGGSLANLLSVYLSGYVANWLAIGDGERAMVWVPADFVQIAGLAMAISAGTILTVWATVDLVRDRRGRRLEAAAS